ncbi:hypothetical protein [Streptomyces aureoversilis]|uniref:Reverse transcriptase domain-containing protein n=1 Tax=Streptomyces aureoversilis TaxID=67277 RepID=A0ABV9ZQQ2_9ACTN
MLRLIKAFLKAGVLTEGNNREDTITGTPQGGILSPLLANIALSALDEYLTRPWEPDDRNGAENPAGSPPSGWAQRCVGAWSVG